MYLMEGRKLLDAQVLNGRQKLLKPSLQTFFSMDFWEFCFFSHFSTYLGVKKHTLFNKFLPQKWQLIWQEIVGGYEGRKGMTFCMLCHWIALFIEYHERIARTCNDGANFSIKGKSLHPTVLIYHLSSYTEYKIVALRKIIIKVNCC